MKKVILLSFGIGTLLFTSCDSKKDQKDSNQNTQEQIAKEDQHLLGGQKDDHGCLASAGENWSELKNTCIQVFNVGKRLNPIEVNKDEAVISAFVVFNDDKSKLELFLPSDGDHHAILDKTEDNVYKDKTYTYNDKESALYVDGVKKFISGK
ncbi:hypothetical protein [Chishuiella sp.]|uniref:hypothetical protein n=1 Tax=Chishuiella sp. TaxID=1969467 RepID=UPI0028ABC2CD|nr:hypothetical protein [Chishuiella sp.]